MKVAKSSAWNRQEIDRFLEETVIPVRLAVFDDKYPLVVSIWFQWDAGAGALLCASHEGAKLVRLLQSNAHCAFEIAGDDPPYKGVRGRGQVLLERAHANDVLTSLIDRYLGNREHSLAKWLLSRIEEEFVIRIEPTWLTSWDFSARMKQDD